MTFRVKHMEGTITISIRDYERLKEDSDSLIKMTTDNKHYLRIFDNNQFGYRRIMPKKKWWHI